MRRSEEESAPHEARSEHAGVIDGDMLQRWLGDSGPASSRSEDDALSSAVLDVLLELVNAAVFVVDGDGGVIMTNVRGRSLRAAHEAFLRPFLQAEDPVDRPTSSGAWEVATPALGSLRISRRAFSAAGVRRALVTVESVDMTFEGILRTASTALGLTARQAGVFRLVLEGLSNKEIASTLRTSERTVEVHVTALLQKAGVDSRMRLIAKTWDLARAGGRYRWAKNRTDQ